MIINALGQFADPAVAAELKPFLRGTTPEIAEAADRAIRRIEWRAGKR